MGIDDETKRKLFQVANGKCQCTMKICKHHTGRCNAVLRGAWEAHRIRVGGSYALSNLKAMCQACHRNTPSYGR